MLSSLTGLRFLDIFKERIQLLQIRLSSKVIYIFFFVILILEIIFPQQVILAAQKLLPTRSVSALGLNNTENIQVGVLPPFRQKQVNEYVTEYKVIRSLRVTVTAYSSTKDQTDSTPFITARNTFVREGVVAANFLKFGTRVRFPDIFGDKVFIVEDRMNTRYRERIDVWMPKRLAAIQFGRKMLNVQIVQEI